MATMNLQFFIGVEEFTEVMDSFIRESGAYLIQKVPKQDATTTQNVRDFVTPDRSQRSRLYVSGAPPSLEVLEQRVPSAVKAGWATLYPPIQVDRVLYLCEFGAKSDWYDVTGTPQQNPMSIKLLSLIRKYFESRIHFPVWARNVNSNHWEEQKHVGYTSSAHQLELAGVRLKQFGVKNVEFTTIRPSTRRT